MKSLRFTIIDVLLIVILLFWCISPVVSMSQTIARVNIDSGGIQAKKGSELLSISADARFIVFVSFSELVPESIEQNNIYILDQQSQKIIANLEGLDAKISADGNVVVYRSSFNSGSILYIYNLLTGEITQINDGLSQIDRSSIRVGGLNENGRFIVFSDSFQGGNNIYIHDSQVGETIKVGVNINDFDPEGCIIVPEPSISRDGRYVAYDSCAETLVDNDTNGKSDVFLYDRVAETTSRVSLTATGGQFMDINSHSPVISGNGRFIAYLAFDLGTENIHIYDQQTGIKEKLPLTDFLFKLRLKPALSGDGRFVTFVDSSLLTGVDLIVFDRQTKELTSVSDDFGGLQGSSALLLPKISDDGRFVVFQSTATSIVMDDTNEVQDIFVLDRGIPEESSIKSAELHLASLGVTVQQARDFIFSHADEPQVIFNVAFEHNVTTSMLSEITGFSTNDISAYFAFFGLDTLQLDK